MTGINYDDRMHAVYAKGRVITPDALEVWMRALARHLPPTRPLAFLDLGCGIGRFTPSLADSFGGPVYGVEPSAKMRAVAESSATHERVTYVAGAAEAIPLPDSSCDGVLIYLVWHHIKDKSAAAAEIARVLRPGGRVFVRTNFGDRMPEYWWYRYLPGALEADTSLYDTLDKISSTFTGAGLGSIAVDEVEWETAPSRADDFERLQLRALSTFERLTEDEITQGFAAIRRALDAGEEPDGPVMISSALFVAGR